ncbi:MAG: hypothetical protein ABI565_09660, partial [Vicinamibacteria bacterium]
EVRVTSAGKEARVGDTLMLSRGDAFTLDADASAALYRGARVEVFWNGERIETAPLGDGHVRFERFASTNGYLRVHVLAPSGAPLAVTNPIWIKMSAH